MKRFQDVRASVIRTVVAVLLVSLVAPLGWATPPKRVDRQELGSTLEQMGMIRLWAALASKTDDPAMKIDALSALANIESDPVRREALLSEATTLLKARCQTLKEQVEELQKKEISGHH